MAPVKPLTLYGSAIWSREMADAAHGPVTDARRSANQWTFDAGVAYAW